MECELCGRPDAAARAEIEGILLNVCDSCARLGKRLDVQPVVLEREKKSIEVNVPSINPDFARIVKDARKKTGLNLEDLGKRISEKTSVLERVERGMRPTDMLAKKLEKALKIKLLGYEEE